MQEAGQRHLPRAAPIESYGIGGFRFADMSHRGSILCLPSAMYAWPVMSASEITEGTLAPVFRLSDSIDILLIGTGSQISALDISIRNKLRDCGISVDVMITGIAAQTWNILLDENRRVAAALIATS